MFNRRKKALLGIIMSIAILCSGCAGGRNNSANVNTGVDVNADTNVAAETDVKVDTGDFRKESAYSLMQTVNSSLADHSIDDKYRTFYEIFPYSFADSDGDGIGDLNGIIQNLDYLNDDDENTDTDLNINGIWLMPVMPSPSYHKYDVTDYMDIDPEYGTLEDFKALMAECEKRDIHVIIDLVMNHTSSEHPWFMEGCKYLESLPQEAEPDSSVCPYVDYYHFSKEKQANYHQVGDSEWYYEGQFWAGMPDLNMENEAVIEEFDQITDFWLDLGVSGFRLDAVGEYESDNVTKSTEILRQFVTEMKTKNPDIYLVGEIWSDMSTYTQYYDSGIDSCFDFAFADSTGIIANTIKGAKNYNASSFGKAQVNIQDTIQSRNTDGIDAPFYTNHDMARGAGYYSGDNSEAQTKIAQAMNLFMSGNAFLYYGEELGMKGSGKDENKRAPMFWSSDKQAEGMCSGPKDMDLVKMKYGSYEEQREDGDSVFQFVKETIKIRNAFPEIARGQVTFEEACSNDSICTIRKSFDGNEILLVYNISENPEQIDLRTLSLNNSTDKKLAAILLTGTEALTYDKGVLLMPSYSVAVLQ